MRPTDAPALTVEPLRFAAEQTMDVLRTPPGPPPPPPDPLTAAALARFLADGTTPLSDMAHAVGVGEDVVVGFTHDFGMWVSFTVQGGPPVRLRDVRVPAGLGPEDLGRDLRRPLGHIQRARPGEDVVTRWVLRSGTRLWQVLSYEIIAVVHFMASIGRLHEVDELVDTPAGFNHHLARVVVQAYDFLESARADAVVTIDRLCDEELPPREFIELLESVLWVAEAPLRRAAADFHGIVGELGYATARARVRSARRLAPERLRPSWIGSLNDGQVRRLCESAGIDVERRPSAFEGEARKLVTAAGLRDEEDVLVPHLAVAMSLGLEDEVASALSARARAEVAWADALNAALQRFDVV